ncbi:glycosyltransferase family 2 protein [Hydrogenibacillus sp. N12]|uniref:glycosyltransferase family 2 protein n=1 Tax=Hydrogenibacillus sp. N12 TaxID=2866627 RepID=UPI001C7DAAFC|nr:glycosyltransferase family 2 protein [Hydrogenibacillus sp. N12]QZA32539.1 glycosyltransferase [Hydrogenibacillus sp. N12]
MVRLTLAMIVRNEAGRLSRALQSVRDVVDEMIVVDTGSTDGTPEIARAHGARVVAVPWQDDFSAARNAGLEFARGDWVFVLDADEWLEPADRGRLKALLWSPALAAYEGGFVQIWNRLGDGREGVAVHPALRLFRNRPEHRFSGRVHEQIAAAIFRRKPDAALFVSDIRVHHDGYLRDVVRLRGKIERNERLLRQALLAAPDDPFLWYNLGVEALRRGAAAEAVQAFVRARETMAPAVSFAPLVYKYEALARRLAGDPDGARAVLEAGCRRYPHHPDLWHLWGEIEAAAGRLWAAEAAYATAYALGPAPPGVPTEAGVGGARTAAALARLRAALGDLAGARRWAGEALRQAPGDGRALGLLLRLAVVAGGEREAVRTAVRLLRVRDVQAAERVAGALRAAGAPRAAAVYVRYLRRFGSPAVQGARPPVGRAPGGRLWAVERWLAGVRHPEWRTGTVLAARLSLFDGATPWIKEAHVAEDSPVAEGPPSGEDRSGGLPLSGRFAWGGGRTGGPAAGVWKEGGIGGGADDFACDDRAG